MTDGTIDPRLFRQVMARFATGVTVITTVVDGTVHGMTATAFMSASLDPPLCIVAVGKTARMHGRLIAAGRYGVSFLADDQRDLSSHFAGPTVPGLEPQFSWHGGTPVLKQALAVIVADLKERHACGDHSLFVGQIRHMAAADRRPLLYFGGRYGALDDRAMAEERDLPAFW